ncbi:MAG: lipoate protein ligase C-terminal domain-containing protein [Candidatus Thorarchaeota archaeon]
MRSSAYKVPEGKLIKVKLWVTNESISKIIIAGDFFLHPEETITLIEENLIGTHLNAKSLETSIRSCLADAGGILIGATPKDIADAIMIAK